MENSNTKQSNAAILSSQSDPLFRIGLPSNNSIIYVHVSEIVYCEASSSQTVVCLSNKRRHVISRTLKQCEEVLSQFGFCRIHRSYLINLAHLSQYDRGESRQVIMKDGKELDVTQGYRDCLIKKLYLL